VSTFHDVLEAQLSDAAERRYRPGRRRLPRIGFEALATAGAVAAGVALIVALSGGEDSATHSGRTPTAEPAAAATLPKVAQGPQISILDAGAAPGTAGVLSQRLADQGAHILTVADSGPQPFTQVLARPGHEAAALAVSRWMGGIDVRDAAFRVLPLGDKDPRWLRAGVATDVLVVLGRADHRGKAQLRADASTLRFDDGCQPGARALGRRDADDATFAVLRHWPMKDGAILMSPALLGDACGTRRSVLVPVLFTATGESETVFVSNVDGCWVIWRTLP
jgi:hypothetical protein